MENSTVGQLDLRTATWEVIHFYHPYCVGGVFVLTAVLILIYAVVLLHNRAHNHIGSLLCLIFFLAFTFSSTRGSLLLIQDFYPETVKPILQLLDCARTVSICSIFGLAFVAVVRSSESSQYHSHASALAKLTCVVCLLVNYVIACTPEVLRHFYTGHHIITQAAIAGADMYFMVVLAIMGLAYMFMLPRTVTMGRNVKSETAAPRRLVAAALVGFLAAVLVLAYVLFLLSGFLSAHTSAFREGDIGRLLQQLHLVGTSGTEALLTGLLVIAAVLLINTPHSLPDVSHTAAGAPEMQGLLYPGRTAISSTYRAQANGFHSLYKADV